VLTVFIMGNAAFHAEYILTGTVDFGIRIGIAAALILVMLIGGRIIPSFTRNWLVRENPGRLPVAFARFVRLFPEFQPYESFQRLLISLLGGELHPTAAWAISLVSGGTIIGFLYAQTYSALPFRNGIGKGLAFAAIAWIILNLALFPAIGLGYFAMRTSAGLGASAFSLVMVSIYGIVMGGTYAVLLKYSNRTS